MLQKFDLKFLSLVISSIFLSVLLNTQAAAQPNEARVKKDLSGPRTISIMLGKPGKIEWSATYKKYIWMRYFTAKVKTDEPDVHLIVTGHAAYDVMGGKYVFWRTFIASNSYEGIPNPNADDVQKLIEKFGVERFMGNYYFNRITGALESIALAAQPEFEWHTPNSVSFNVRTVYTERINDIGGRERVERIFRVRLYRDNPKSEWKSMNSTPQNKTVL